ncbi:hypothetical protein TgHK011_004913 [Trichoderma gracile]|nr:hypothetical protein TgHK011_004913 [Trichoderma gracile]
MRHVYVALYTEQLGRAANAPAPRLLVACALKLVVSSDIGKSFSSATIATGPYGLSPCSDGADHRNAISSSLYAIQYKFQLLMFADMDSEYVIHSPDDSFPRRTSYDLDAHLVARGVGFLAADDPPQVDVDSRDGLGYKLPPTTRDGRMAALETDATAFLTNIQGGGSALWWE